MSDRETAEKIIKTEGLIFAMACLPPQKELAAAREILRDAIAAALAAEREACAKVAQNLWGERDEKAWMAACNVIEDAIRARCGHD